MVGMVAEAGGGSVTMTAGSSWAGHEPDFDGSFSFSSCFSLSSVDEVAEEPGVVDEVVGAAVEASDTPVTESVSFALLSVTPALAPAPGGDGDDDGEGIDVGDEEADEDAVVAAEASLSLPELFFPASEAAIVVLSTDEAEPEPADVNDDGESSVFPLAAVADASPAAVPAPGAIGVGVVGVGVVAVGLVVVSAAPA